MDTALKWLYLFAQGGSYEHAKLYADAQNVDAGSG